MTTRHNPSCMQLLGVSLLLLTAVAVAATGTHLPESTLYPRLLRLHHGKHRGTILAKTGNRIFRSTDEGRSFTPLARVPTGGETAPADTPDGTSRERCCSTLFELPRAIGTLRAGTLLYAASFFAGDVPAVEIFVSADGAEHWKYLTTPLRAGDAHHGLWEPEFTMVRDGSLLMFVSDETDSCCSQKLVQLQTRDGTVWSKPADTVASHAQTDRPGMAVVSRLRDGTSFMTYEICGPAYHCAVFSRTSRDGVHFGDPFDPGTHIETASGAYLAHAPGNIVLQHGRFPWTRQDTLLVAGQMLFNADRSVAADNGKVLLKRKTVRAGGAWRTVPAPVEVPAAKDNYCPNYSSALLPVSDGHALLELASDYDETHHCTSYFAIASLQALMKGNDRQTLRPARPQKH